MTRNTKVKDIILETTDEKSRNYKWEDNYKSLNNISVISNEQLPEELNDFKFIGRKKGIDNVFLKNPFNDNEYIEISKAEDLIFESKIALYSEILCALGAKSFVASAEFIEEKKMEFGTDGKVKFKLATLDTATKNELSEKFQKTFNLSAKFKDTKNFDALKSYEEAKSLFKIHKLDSEKQLESLIKNNDPSKGRTQNFLDINVQISHEFTDLIECAANISTMPGVFSLSADYKSNTESIKKINLKYTIDFGE